MIKSVLHKIALLASRLNLTCEHLVLWLAIPCLHTPLTECRSEGAVHGYRLMRCFGLCFANVLMNHGTA